MNTDFMPFDPSNFPLYLSMDIERLLMNYRAVKINKGETTWAPHIAFYQAMIMIKRGFVPTKMRINNGVWNFVFSDDDEVYRKLMF